MLAPCTANTAGTRHTQVILVTDSLKSAAISVTVMDTVKKSKASHVQPRKPARNISH